jgi:hypothetical protein
MCEFRIVLEAKTVDLSPSPYKIIARTFQPIVRHIFFLFVFLNRSIAFSAFWITFGMVWLYTSGDVECDDIDFDPDEGTGEGVNGIYKSGLPPLRQ